MNLIPVPYIKEEQKKKSLKQVLLIILLLGSLGSFISVLLPFRIYALQEKVNKLKADPVIQYSEQRDTTLGAIYEKQQLLEILEEAKKHIDLERKTYFSDVEYMLYFTDPSLQLNEIIYKGGQQGWEGSGESVDIVPIQLYKARLENAYPEEQLTFQIEKQGELWHFVFEVSQVRGETDEEVE